MLDDIGAESNSEWVRDDVLGYFAIPDARAVIDFLHL